MSYRSELHGLDSNGDPIVRTPLVEQWRALDRQASAHLDSGHAGQPCQARPTSTCPAIVAISQEMRGLWAQMTEAERDTTGDAVWPTDEVPPTRAPLDVI